MVKFESPSYPVIGQVTPWFAKTKFMAFETGEIGGLAFVKDETIEIMAVIAHKPGKGHFREFVDRLKACYRVVRFWAVMNEKMEDILIRYDFIAGIDADEYGEMTDVWQWERKL